MAGIGDDLWAIRLWLSLSPVVCGLYMCCRSVWPVHVLLLLFLHEMLLLLWL